MMDILGPINMVRIGGAEPVVTLTPFTLTAAAGGFVDGDGYAAGSFGSISNEPIGAGNALITLTTLSIANLISIRFFGDVTSLVSGLSIHVDGNNIGTPSWGYSAPHTRTNMNPVPVTFLPGTDYYIEFK